MLFRRNSNNSRKGGEKNGISKTCNLGTKYSADGSMQAR